MKVALVHDYLNEYGGAERVLEALVEIYPDAPIYTAFYKEGSLAYEKFRDRKIVASWAQNVPFFATKLHSPLRFLAPWIWNSFDFSEFDVVISSASWYVTKGFGSRFPLTSVLSQKERKTTEGKNIKEICYCHTPPRWLYGYKTSVEFQKYWPIKVYAIIVGHFMRMYDYRAAQKVDYFIANSQEVAARIKKFYRRDSVVIYPPVSLASTGQRLASSSRKDYYFMVARLVGSKGLDMAIAAAEKGNFKLKIAGVPGGYSRSFNNSGKARMTNKNVEFLGYVTDEELVQLYASAKGFLALAQDEDFGITPVEAQLAGTGVVAYYGGGYKETVIDGKTGVFFKEYTVDNLIEAIQKFGKMKISSDDCRKNAERFSKKRFEREIRSFVEGVVK